VTLGVAQKIEFEGTEQNSTNHSRITGRLNTTKQKYFTLNSSPDPARYRERFCTKRAARFLQPAQRLFGQDQCALMMQ